MNELNVYLSASGYAGSLTGGLDGWAAVAAWVSTLPDDAGLGLSHLVEQGWVDDLDDLATELADALKDHPPDDPDVLEVLTSLQEVLEGRAGNDEALALGAPAGVING